MVALFAIKGIVIAVILPARPMSPDEGLYVVVLESLVREDDIIQAGNALGYGPIIFTGSWLPMRPAQFLTSLGVDQLESLRLTSLLFSSLALPLVCPSSFARARVESQSGACPL